MLNDCFYYFLTEEEQKWDQVIDPSELYFHHPSIRLYCTRA